MRHLRLAHEFVHHIPERLEPAVLYISVDYAVAIHLCCCGCGEQIVTPLAPGGWKMIFDGETISLRPSIGNWQLPCRSHYIIDRGEALVAAPWSECRHGRRNDGREPKDIETVVRRLRGEPEESDHWWQRLFGRRKE